MVLKEVMLGTYIFFLNAVSARELCIVCLLFSKKLGIVTFKKYFYNLMWLICKDEIHSKLFFVREWLEELGSLSQDMYFCLHLYTL